MPLSFSDTLQERLKALIEAARGNWTYAIFWESSPVDGSIYWGDGYYFGERNKDERKLKTAVASSSSWTEEQAHRKKVLGDLSSLTTGVPCDDLELDEYVTDAEWFFLVSMTQSFVIGSGLPGQALFKSSPIRVAGAKRLAASHCERARQCQELGLRTMVCIPTTYGVVELGSTGFPRNSILALREQVKRIIEGKDWLETSSSLFTMDVIRIPSPPSVNQANEPHMGMWQIDTWVQRAAQQEKPHGDSGLRNDEVERVGIGGVGITGEGEMVEGDQLNSGCLGNGKRKEKIRGVGIKIALEDILQTKGMTFIHAAKNLNVSQSTLKLACREYGIHKWPPCKKLKLIYPSQSNESRVVVDQEQIPQLNSATVLPSDHFLATIDTDSVTVKARYGKVTIKFMLSWPWRKIELEQEVEKRLKFGTYIQYRDEDNELILIACDEDLQDCISSSMRLGICKIEVFLEPK